MMTATAGSIIYKMVLRCWQWPRGIYAELKEQTMGQNNNSSFLLTTGLLMLIEPLSGDHSDIRVC